MEWTTQPPAVPGWYWARTNGFVEVVRVAPAGNGRLYAQRVKEVFKRRVDASPFSAWAGPIPGPPPAPAPAPGESP